MPGNYTDTTDIVAGQPVAAADIKDNFDDLDDAVKAVSDATPGGGATGFYNMIRNGDFAVWERGTAAAPDNWVVTGSGATLAREASIIKYGTYSAKLTRVGNDCHLSQNVYDFSGKTYLRSRLVIMGAWVYATVASRARLRLSDGTTTNFSSYHTGGSAWEFLTVSLTTGGAITALNAGLQVDTGDTSAYLSGATLVEGGTIYGLIQNAPPFNHLPQRVTLWHDEALVTHGNAIAATVTTTHVHNAVWQQSPAAQNDAFTQSVWLEEGTYSFSALGQTGTGKGIVTWTLDGVSIGTHDWYQASQTQNVVKTTSSVSVVGSGYHVLKGTVSSKNASSSAYAVTLVKYWFKPASD